MADDFPWFIKYIPRLTFDIKSYINSKNLYLLYISNSFIYFLIHDNLKKKKSNRRNIQYILSRLSAICKELSRYFNRQFWNIRGLFPTDIDDILQDLITSTGAIDHRGYHLHLLGGSPNVIINIYSMLMITQHSRKNPEASQNSQKTLIFLL